MQKTTFNVQGMDCADEVAAVDRALRLMTGVSHIQVNLVLGTVTVDHDTASTAAIITALGKVGLRASIEQGTRRVIHRVLQHRTIPQVQPRPPCHARH
ncbi:MAG: heavy-metal-associated domain-containing protein [Ignavibacteria bacterium]|nr:heavy-metal-associated domain-containing protein [Ignavibacteria bacterium]